VITSRIGEERKSHEIKGHYQANVEGALNASMAIASDNFLTWPEIEEMEKSRLIDIQSHTLTHARYFASEKIKDFNSGTPPWWLPFATGGDVRPGIPIYEDEKALLCLRYFDDVELRDCLAKYVEERGAEIFFKSRKKEEWLDELYSVAGDFISRTGGLKGHFETEEEKRIRINRELYLSKKEIEERLGKSCLFICWPWGKFDEELISLAKSIGYCGAATTEKGANTINIDPMSLKRFDIKKGELRWFKLRMAIYSHGVLARIYPIIRGK
jgi:hypothetical protein